MLKMEGDKALPCLASAVVAEKQCEKQLSHGALLPEIYHIPLYLFSKIETRQMEYPLIYS